jgi:transcriptional regulator with XRE-family HTH domain
MKADMREEARRLRRNEELSLNEICRRLGVSKGSVSVWVRDIELTPEQKAELERQHYAYRAQANGGATNARKFRDIRIQYQEQGRAKARERDPLHIAGCMLYSGEGTKHKNRLALTNSDPDMMKFYVRFLREGLHVQDEEMTLHIHCYVGNNIDQEQIEAFWLELLGLPRTCLRKTMVNFQPSSSDQKGRKLLYGVCKLAVGRTQLVQHVLGAIQEYTGIDKLEWLL